MQRGDTLVVSVELVDVVDGTSRWGERYQRRVADIFEVQEEIAREISDRLQVRLTSTQRKRLAKRATSNAAAYQAYLRGRYEANQWTAAGFHRALEQFKHALGIDPGYALAYAGLSDLYASLTAAEVLGLSPQEQVAKAREAAWRALALDESLAEAHLALAEIQLTYDWDWDGADARFKRALELSPNLTIALHRLSHLLVPLRRWDESLAVSLRALELDPLDPEMHVHLGWHRLAARQYNAAVEACRQALAIDPQFHEAFWFMGVALGELGQLDVAIDTLRRGVELSGSATQRASLGYVLAKAGQTGQAREILTAFERETVVRHVAAFNFALIHAGLGDAPQTLHWLVRGLTEHGSQMPQVAVDPRFEFLHEDQVSGRSWRACGCPSSCRLCPDVPALGQRPGGANPFDGSSSTSTQSWPSPGCPGGTNRLTPVFGTSPIGSACPSRGLYHHARSDEAGDRPQAKLEGRARCTSRPSCSRGPVSR